MKRRTFLEGALSGGVGLGSILASSAHAAQPKSSGIRVDRDALIDLAKELAKIPSFTTEETACAEFLHEMFERAGFESELQEVDPGRFQTIARLRGTGGGKSLMLNGHIDIDPIPDGVTHDPWQPEVSGDVLWGAGLGNMKGGVAAMVHAALEAKRQAGALRGDVVVAAVVGELQGGPGTVHLLKTGLRTDFAIVGEPSGADFIRTKHAGVVQLAVHVLGKTTHISTKQRGVNAILKAGKVAQAMETLEITGPRDPDLPALPLVNVGSILGGRGREVELRGPNNVPDFCSIYADIRFTPGMTPETVVTDLRARLETLKASDPELVFEIEYPLRPDRRMLREVMMPFSIDASHPMIQLLKEKVTQARGLEPQLGVKLPNAYGGTDASHLAPAGIPCCIYGPGARGDGADHYLGVSIDEMTTVSQAYASMIEAVCG